MFAKFLNLIKRAVVTRPGGDAGNYAIQQIRFNGAVGDCEVVFPYGMHANLPIGSLVTVFAVNGNLENRSAIGGLPGERIKNLPEGEVVYFHPLTKSKIHFKNNGDIDIESVNDINVNVVGNVNITVEGNVDLEATQVSVTADSVDVTAPQSTFNGNVLVDGDLEVTGTTTLAATVTSDGINIGSTHTHDGVTPGGGTSGPPTP